MSTGLDYVGVNRVYGGWAVWAGAGFGAGL